jgi:hypothetical protein
LSQKEQARTQVLNKVLEGVWGIGEAAIMPSNGRLSYARARVEVHERLDGSLAVYYEGHCLATSHAPPEAPMLRLTRKIGNQTRRLAPRGHVSRSLQRQRQRPRELWVGGLRRIIRGGKDLPHSWTEEVQADIFTGQQHTIHLVLSSCKNSPFGPFHC